MRDKLEPTIEPVTNLEEVKAKKSFKPSSLILHPLFLRVAGTALLLFFLWRLNLDWGKVWEELLKANLWYVGASILLVVPFIALKAWRWQLILRGLGIQLDFGQAYRVYALGLAAGSFTPGQAGDFIKAWHLKEQGHPLSTCLLSAILDRLFDLAVLLLLAATGLLVLGADFVGALPGLLALLIGVIAALVALSVPTIRDRLMQLALRLANPGRKTKGGRPKAKDLQLGNSVLSPQSSVLSQPLTFLLTLAGSGLALLRVWLLALALGLQLGPMETIAASSLATVVSLLPISVAGIGARDLALVGILGKLGYSVEKAVSLSSCILLLTLVNLVAGYLIWYSRPQKSESS